MNVIVWGPNPDDKRQTIVAALEAVPYTAVVTPETLQGQMPELEALGDIWYQEEVQASKADAVICLIKNGRTGAPMEITKFKDHVRIAPKIRLLRPRDLDHPEAVVNQAVKAFPAAQAMTYTPAHLVRCVNIRNKCLEWLAAMRAEKFRRAWRADHPIL